MNFEQLRYFKAVVSCQSFSDAAKVLKVSQPTVTNQIANLEHSLGAKLVDRSSKELICTEAGAFLFSKTNEILSAVKEIE